MADSPPAATCSKRSATCRSSPASPAHRSKNRPRRFSKVQGSKESKHPTSVDFGYWTLDFGLFSVTSWHGGTPMSSDLKHRSRAITDGPDRAPARAMFKAIGLTDEDLAKPLVGVANTWIEVMPCNFHLRR